MIYADTAEMVAVLILDDHRHVCSPHCICAELRTIPGVQEAIRKLQAQPGIEREESCWT